MDNYVMCCQCKYYIWPSVDKTNSYAFCDKKYSVMFAGEKVCEHFILK